MSHNTSLKTRKSCVSEWEYILHTHRVFNVQVDFFDPYPDQSSVDQNAWIFPDFLNTVSLWEDHKKFYPISLPVFFYFVSRGKYAKK